MEQTAIQTNHQPETSIAAVIERAAKDPTIDVSKMERLLEFGIRIQEREAEQHFNRDFALALTNMPYVTKRGVISLGTGKGSIPFARYEDLDRAIRPTEIEFGFSRSFLRDGTNMVLILAHKDGHSIRSIRPIVLDAGPARNNSQAEGSGASYAKRYLTKDIWNIITDGEDDDANSSEPITGDEAYDLKMTLEAAGGDVKDFLAKVAHADSFEKIQRRDFEKCQAQIRKKHKTTHKETAE